MRSFKAPERLDRATYWMWVVPLVVAHIVLTQLAVHGVSALGGLDVVTVLWLARTVGGRFRDIGWRPWIGISFILVTMVALPLVALAVAIAIKLPPNEMTILLGAVGVSSGVLNLVLIVVAGSVPGTDRLDKLITVFDEAEMRGGEAMPATGHPGAAPIVAPPFGPSSRPAAWAIGGMGAAILVLGAVIALSFVLAPRAPAISSGAPPIAASGGNTGPSQARPLASNGLTKETNDFLRQLSAKGAPGGAANRPAQADNSIWPDPSKVLRQQKAAP